MPLTCSCDCGNDPKPGGWYFDWFLLDKIDFEPLDGKKRKRCASCGELIDIGALCLRHKRHRYPYTEVEARITGGKWDDWEEPWIQMSDVYQCEKCGEIWLNLKNVGFDCLYPNEDMQDALRVFINTYFPQPLYGESKKQKMERIKNRPAKKYGEKRRRQTDAVDKHKNKTTKTKTENLVLRS